MLCLPIHGRARFVLVRPHYPENVGASARALKTMGFSQLWLVKPGKLAMPEHEMAHKMAVKSWDVLDQIRIADNVEQAVEGASMVLATTSHRGVTGVWTARDAAAKIVARVAEGSSVAILFGNEKTGLEQHQVLAANERLRIPMAADQPSINLAQAVQIVAYELMVAALAHRASGAESSA